jgi:hypothetical protein
LPTPIADEVQVIVLPATAEAGQITPTLETAPLRAIVAAADLVGSCVLVTVTVTEDPVVGAVRTPAGVMLPAEVDQVTAEE